jgi:catechol 1,2-dioxygenase
MVLNVPKDGQMAYMHGKLTDGKTGEPIRNASVELWQASTNGTWASAVLLLDSLLKAPGLYEQQDPEQTEHNLRGKLITDAEGEYACYCLRPTPYPVSCWKTLVRNPHSNR